MTHYLFSGEHDAFRAAVRDWAAVHLGPHIDE
jgi:hypothetical protein